MRVVEGDYERLQARMSSANGEVQPSTDPFPDPIPASALKKLESHDRWLWEGYLARGGITLLSALWKAGKSTLLAHLLKAMADGTDFCGRQTKPARVLVITEEPEDIWADRRDLVGIADHVWFQPRPFLAKPKFERWQEFLFHLKAARDLHAYDLLILDTISNLWPIKDENDNAQVQAALMPLRSIAPEVALLLVHHLRKGDGTEATASRGAGAFPAFVEVIMELRRFTPGDARDRRRVLAGYSRYRETPDELVIELDEDELAYAAQGSRAEVRQRTMREILDSILPSEPPGWTQEKIAAEWPGETSPKRKNLLDLLRLQVEQGNYQRTGSGRKGDPYHYWTSVSPNASVPVSPYIYRETETESDEGVGEGVY